VAKEAKDAGRIRAFAGINSSYRIIDEGSGMAGSETIINVHPIAGLDFRIVPN